MEDDRHTYTKYLMPTVMAASLAACSLFDSGIPWRGGPYQLLWIDDPHQVALMYRLDANHSAERVAATVYSVGWDGRYVVAKQHPDGDKSVTNYFILDAQRDSPLANEKQAVIGPLSQKEFRQKSKQLKLPGFTTTLKSLE